MKLVLAQTAAFLCCSLLFCSCSAPGAASTASAAPSSISESTSSQAASAQNPAQENRDPTPPAAPAATGFANLSRLNNSIFGSGGKDGCYETYAADNGGVNVVYIDYATANEIYLCSAPNCTHDSDACNAWIPPEEAGLAPLVTGDHLLLLHRTYGAETGYQAIPRIDHMNLYGSDRYTLIEFEPNEMLKDVFAANGDILVCALTSVSADGDTAGEVYKLVMVDLTTGERTDFYQQSTDASTQPLFMGVTESGYCILASSRDTLSEADFPDKDWDEISGEVKAARENSWDIVPVGSDQRVTAASYTGAIEQMMGPDGIYFYDPATEQLCRVSFPDGQITTLATLPGTGTMAPYLDCKMDDWLLLSFRTAVERETQRILTTDTCYAVNTVSGEVRELSIRQEIGDSREMAWTLAQNDTDMLLVTKSETDNYIHYGYEYSVISKEDYLNSNAAGLRKVTFIEEQS